MEMFPRARELFSFERLILSLIMLDVAGLLALIAFHQPTAATVAVPSPSDTFAKRMQSFQADYDPNKCKTDPHGHIYYSLGDTVFALPNIPNPAFLDPLEPKMLREAPDPTDQVGCLGNPYQQRILTAFWTKAMQVRLYWNWRPLQGPSRARADWRGELLPIDMAEIKCKEATITETLTNGLSACRVKPLRDVRVEDWAASYVSDPAKYATPMGRSFIVSCGPELMANAIDDCKVAYSLKPDLGVSYKFKPYHAQVPLPVDRVIDEDKKLRESIDQAEVKDFKWPSPAKSRPEELH